MELILVAIAIVFLAGTAALLAAAPRLRAEIDQLHDAFGLTSRSIQPLVATVRADRDRLAGRLARFHEGGADPAER